MFAGSGADLHRKRFRDDDEDASPGLPVGFTEHRSVSQDFIILRFR
jgi:hypothetical protein